MYTGLVRNLAQWFPSHLQLASNQSFCGIRLEGCSTHYVAPTDHSPERISEPVSHPPLLSPPTRGTGPDLIFYVPFQPKFVWIFISQTSLYESLQSPVGIAPCGDVSLMGFSGAVSSASYCSAIFIPPPLLPRVLDRINFQMEEIF